MEKRALVALVLSLAVLLFWEYYFGLVHTPKTVKENVGNTTAASSSPAGSALPRTPQATTPQQLPQDRLTLPDQHFPKWSVGSPLYSAQILTPGARLDSFQLKKFRKAVETDSPPIEMISSRTTGYLPTAVDLLHHPSFQFSTISFRSDAPDTIELSSGRTPQTVSFFAEVPGQAKLTKTYTFRSDSYVVDLEIQLENLSDEVLSDQLGVSLFFEPLSSSSEESSYNKSQLASFEKGSFTAYDISDLVKKEVIFKSKIDWIGYGNNYFIQALIPLDDQSYQIVPRVIDEKKGLIQVVYLTEPFQLDPKSEKIFKTRLYIGPKELDQLKLAEHNLDHAVDYGWFSFLAVPSLYVLKWIYKYTHNYGVAIILLTVLIKILFWPMTQKSYKSMQAMKKIQPKIAQLREKFKDDREKLNQELMALYRTYKVNPMGGCLPMVLQIPVFIALYRMLNTAVELRHEPFMWWMNDLTAPDRLNIGIHIPYLGGIPVLTLLMGVSMFVQQKMTPSGGDPRQEQLMLLMPVIFTVFFINFPAGLVLYWLVNNILSIVQQYWINRYA